MVVVVVLVVVVVVVVVVLVVVVVVVVVAAAAAAASASSHISGSCLRSDTLRSFCEVSLWLMVVWSTYASSSAE